MTSVPPPFKHPAPPPSRPELPEGATPPPPEPTPGGLPALGVPAWAPFAGLLATFVGVLLVSAVVGIAIGIGGGEVDTDDQGLTLVLTAVQAVILVVVAWYTVEILGGRRPNPEAFGLRVPRPLQALGWALVAYLILWAATIVAALVFGEPDDQQLVQDIQEEDSFAVLAGYALLSCLLAPLAEEFFFRGFMFRALAGRMQWVWAAIVSGGVFGAIHALGSPIESVLLLSVFGFVLCLLFWRTASLIPCIMLHAFNNSITFGVTKELPWWGFLLLMAGSVGTTLAVSLLAVRLRRSTAAPAPA
jgi:membrane protease YdiL (CAAX protease family)